MGLIIKGLHIEELIIDTDPEEEQTEPVPTVLAQLKFEPEKSEPIQEEPKEEEPVKKAPRKRSKPLDKGKVGALYKAGWNVAKIADEMRCNQSSIYRVIKEMGL